MNRMFDHTGGFAEGAMTPVTSTSALRRGLPQTIAACAPKRYHCSSCSRDCGGKGTEKLSDGRAV